MTHTEKVKAMLAGEKLNRPGLALWKHFPLVDRDVDKMVATTIKFQHDYQSNFVKLSYNGLYFTEDWGNTIKWPTVATDVGVVTDFIIKKPEDWAKLKVLSPTSGALGRELAITEGVLKEFRGSVPVIATIFSPLTIAIKLAGDETLFKHLNEYPEALHQGLELITETSNLFLKELVNLGIDGIFFASQLSTFDRLSPEKYDIFGVKYDLELFAQLTEDVWFNIIHIHGNEPMVEKLDKYPVQAINWHDRIAHLSMEEVAKLTDKILIGGIEDQYAFEHGNRQLLNLLIEDAISQAGSNNRLIIGPGCVMPLTAADEKFSLVRDLVGS